MNFKTARDRNLFIIKNKGLVHCIYNKTFAKKNINRCFKDDFIQVGLVAFNDALNKYDPNKLALSSYVQYPVFSAMLKFSYRSTNVISLGVNRNRTKTVQIEPGLSFIEKAFKDSHEAESSALIVKMLDKVLNSIEKEVICGMIFSEQTSPEIGEKLHYTGSNIRYIKDKALSKLKIHLESQVA